jgi:hypothetical protein
LPDRELLDVHRRIAIILKESGVARAVGRCHWRYEERKWDGIASDGSTPLEDILADRMLTKISGDEGDEADEV